MAETIVTKGGNPVKTIFDELRKVKGERGFTFLGRLVTPEMDFAEVLKKIPQQELEEAMITTMGIKTAKMLRGGIGHKTPDYGGEAGLQWLERIFGPLPIQVLQKAGMAGKGIEQIRKRGEEY